MSRVPTKLKVALRNKIGYGGEPTTNDTECT